VNEYHSLADPDQRAILDRLYGKCSVQTPEEQEVKDLYSSLKLPELYQKYEQESYDKIMALRGTVKEVPWEVFDAFLRKIYKRQK